MAKPIPTWITIVDPNEVRRTYREPSRRAALDAAREVFNKGPAEREVYVYAVDPAKQESNPLRVFAP